MKFVLGEVDGKSNLVEAGFLLEVGLPLQCFPYLYCPVGHLREVGFVWKGDTLFNRGVHLERKKQAFRYTSSEHL